MQNSQGDVEVDAALVKVKQRWGHDASGAACVSLSSQPPIVNQQQQQQQRMASGASAAAGAAVKKHQQSQTVCGGKGVGSCSGRSNSLHSSQTPQPRPIAASGGQLKTPNAAAAAAAAARGAVVAAVKSRTPSEQPMVLAGTR